MAVLWVPTELRGLGDVLLCINGCTKPGPGGLLCCPQAVLLLPQRQQVFVCVSHLLHHVALSSLVNHLGGKLLHTLDLVEGRGGARAKDSKHALVGGGKVNFLNDILHVANLVLYQLYILTDNRYLDGGGCGYSHGGRWRWRQLTVNPRQVLLRTSHATRLAVQLLKGCHCLA